MRRDRGSQRKRVGVDRAAVDQPRLAERESAGLVEDDGVDFGEAFQRAAILDHDALLEQAPRGNDLHHGNGEAERAGARDDQDRDGDRERPMDVSGCGHPADECRRGGQVDDGSVEPGGAIGDAPVRRASGLRRLHHPHHLGQERILCGGGGGDRERARQVERAGLEQGACGCRLRDAFAGDERAIEVGLSLRPGHRPEPLAGRQQDRHARLDLVHREIDLRAVRPQDERAARRQAGKPLTAARARSRIM